MILSGVFLKEKLSKTRITAVSICLAGLAIMTPFDTGLRATYMAFAFGAAFLHACTILILRHGAFKDSLPTMVIYYTLMSGAGAFLINGGQISLPATTQILALIAVSVIQLGVFYGVMVALRKSKASDVAPFEYASLFWSVMFDLTVFNASYSYSTLIGISCIVFGSLFPIFKAVGIFRPKAPKI